MTVDETDQQAQDADFDPFPTIPPPPYIDLPDDHVGLTVNANDSDDDQNMTEATVAPGPFKGQQTDEPITWLKRFGNYCKFKAYDEVRQLALFRALMQDTASDWLESIPDETAFSEIEKLFTDRFKS